jgi:uncharacterized membrane protein
MQINETKTAMPEIKETITINRPVSDVFRYVADLNNAAQWQPDVVEAHVSGERARVGSFFTHVRTTRLLGWKLDLNADVVNLVPNRLIEYKGAVARFPVRGQYEFESSGGTTVVREYVNVRMGFLYAIFSPLMSSAIAGRTRRSLANLKQTLEAGRSGTDSVTSFHQDL